MDDCFIYINYLQDCSSANYTHTHTHTHTHTDTNIHTYIPTLTHIYTDTLIIQPICSPIHTLCCFQTIVPLSLYNM